MIRQPTPTIFVHISLICPSFTHHFHNFFLPSFTLNTHAVAQHPSLYSFECLMTALFDHYVRQWPLLSKHNFSHRNSRTNQLSFNDHATDISISKKSDIGYILEMISFSSFQGIDFQPFKLNTYKLYRDLHFLYNDPAFNNASVLHPINAPEDFYILHSYFSRVS